jgi:short-subunit dehydrogenase
MTGRVCVVTGGTSGIGRATAEGLARLGATVVLIARQAEQAAQVSQEIATKARVPPDVIRTDL